MIQTLEAAACVRTCPICGDGASSRLFAEANLDSSRLDGFAFSSRKTPEFMHYQLLECAACDLIYAAEAPTSDFLADAYDAADFESSVEAEFASRSYASVTRRILPRLSDLDGALDIGTGDGVFLERLVELGFTSVEGVEPSDAPIRAAKPHIQPKIRHGLFREQDFEAGRYRLITCFQTIEHVDAPLDLARSAAGLLKPGGAFVLVCHNRRGLLNSILGPRSPIRDIEHLQLFSPRSAVRLLECAGYEGLTARPIVNRYPLDYWLRLLPLPTALKSSIRSAANRIGLGRLVVPMAVGNLAVVGFKPMNADAEFRIAA